MSQQQRKSITSYRHQARENFCIAVSLIGLKCDVVGLFQVITKCSISNGKVPLNIQSQWNVLVECFVSTVSQRILRNESFNHKSSIIVGNSFIETRLSRLKKEWHLLGASIPPVILILKGFQLYTSVTVVFLYSPLIVNEIGRAHV